MNKNKPGPRQEDNLARRFHLLDFALTFDDWLDIKHGKENPGALLEGLVKLHIWQLYSDVEDRRAALHAFSAKTVKDVVEEVFYYNYQGLYRYLCQCIPTAEMDRVFGAFIAKDGDTTSTALSGAAAELVNRLGRSCERHTLLVSLYRDAQATIVKSLFYTYAEGNEVFQRDRATLPTLAATFRAIGTDLQQNLAYFAPFYHEPALVVLAHLDGNLTYKNHFFRRPRDYSRFKSAVKSLNSQGVVGNEAKHLPGVSKIRAKVVASMSPDLAGIGDFRIDFGSRRGSFGALLESDVFNSHVARVKQLLEQASRAEMKRITEKILSRTHS